MLLLSPFNVIFIHQALAHVTLKLNIHVFCYTQLRPHSDCLTLT